MQEDTHHTLSDIRDRSGNNIVTSLIGLQKYKREKQKSLDWFEELLVLQPFVPGDEQPSDIQSDDSHRILQRSRLAKGDYAAISYPWSPSPYEVPNISYYVKDENSSTLVKSHVRDSILDRVLLYLEHHGITYFWIDVECINQNDTEEKQKAMESMDLVYKFSKYPVAFLFVPIRTQREMDLLARLLWRKFVRIQDRYSDPELAANVNESMALEILTLVQRITSDQWWNRGWTFQEEYLAESDMRLMLPHFPGLHNQPYKSVMGSFSSHNEIEISSTIFRRQLTLFCIAYLSQASKRGWQVDSGCCHEILAKAGRYTSLSEYGHLIGHNNFGKAMSPLIFADIGSRDISIKSDVLHIAANCCGYSLSMNTSDLTKDKHSLSLSSLALFLMNGELIWNYIGRNSKDLLSQNIWAYMKQISFNAFNPPVDHRGLSFLKRCRLVDPQLTNDGILTEGHLWKVDEILQFTYNKPPIRAKRKRGRPTASSNGDSTSALTESILEQLQQRLSEGHPKLAFKLEEFLEREFDPELNYEVASSTKMMTLTGIEIARAAEKGRPLALGSLLCSEQAEEHREMLGLFVLDEIPSKLNPVYVFTAWQAGRTFNKRYKHQPDADKFVALEVTLDKSSARVPEEVDTPQGLRTKSWVHGLFFFTGEKSRKYLFPWPSSLLE